MPDTLNAAEQLYFCTMRRVSADYFAKRINADTAKRESMMAAKALDKNLFLIKSWEKSTAVWASIEAAATKYWQERTVEAADEFYKAVYGVPLKG